MKLHVYLLLFISIFSGTVYAKKGDKFNYTQVAKIDRQKYYEICIEAFNYLAFFSHKTKALTPIYDKSGKPERCNIASVRRPIKVCVLGTAYYQLSGNYGLALAPAFEMDGTVMKCGMENKIIEN